MIFLLENESKNISSVIRTQETRIRGPFDFPTYRFYFLKHHLGARGERGVLVDRNYHLYILTNMSAIVTQHVSKLSALVVSHSADTYLCKLVRKHRNPAPLLQT